MHVYLSMIIVFHDGFVIAVIHCFSIQLDCFHTHGTLGSHYRMGFLKGTFTTDSLRYVVIWRLQFLIND